ncbi:DUF3040 domain-containing protein [Nonomuraea sp. CA-141351]|uniref:DUF3040 domain-containing protein n=1 Tax=Nonomuraea sp. CA-141351 TaxID=3239996 RepID=UPI003D8F595F
MALSEEEQRIISEIEDRLSIEDPRLDALLSRSLGGDSDLASRTISTPTLVMWTLAAVTSIVLTLAVVLLLSYPDWSGDVRPSPSAIPFTSLDAAVDRQDDNEVDALHLPLSKRAGLLAELFGALI